MGNRLGDTFVYRMRAVPRCAIVPGDKGASMSTARMTTLRHATAVGVVTAVVLTPMLPMTAAQAAGLCSPPADTVPPQVTQVTFNRQFGEP